MVYCGMIFQRAGTYMLPQAGIPTQEYKQNTTAGYAAVADTWILAGGACVGAAATPLQCPPMSILLGGW